MLFRSSVIVITFLSRIHIERRLKVLQNHVKQLMKGNTPDEIPTHIEDEIGQITTEINLLTQIGRASCRERV